MKYRVDQPLDLHLHDGEPVFVLRSQDVLAVPAITQYARLAVQIGEYELSRQVQAAALEVAEWQAAHPDLVKVPD